MPFELVGQDRALEQLYRVLRMHSQQPVPHPLVVLCCGMSFPKLRSLRLVINSSQALVVMERAYLPVVVRSVLLELRHCTDEADKSVGSLLNVPTHTVNMTTLQSGHDLWQSRSMSPYESVRL